MELSAESVLALAPDAASAKAANGLLKPGGWPLLGANDAAVWGECQGSGSKPYQTQVDLSGPTFKCSCPSRKFPCKHGLALLLLRAKDASLFTATTPPAWVADWLSARTERVQKKEEKQREQAASPTAEPSAAALKSAQQRWAKMATGAAELQPWLLDQLARGLGSLGPQSRAAWETMAARLVDAKAPGLGQRLSNAAAGLLQGANWPESTLRQLGLLQLACEAVARRDALSEAAQTDLRVMLGWPLEKETVLAQSPGVLDHWQIIGVVQEERDNNVQERRVWLQGEQTGRRALLLEHAFGGRGFEQSWLPFSSHAATLAFYPSAAPLRAIVVNSQVIDSTSAAPTPTSTLAAPAASAATTASAAPVTSAAHVDTSPAQEWRALAQRVADNPWIPLHPLRCHAATPCREADGFSLLWGGQSLPLTLTANEGWALLALSGGQPLSLMGEWNGETLRPLSASGADGVWNWSMS
ncbi:MAG: SWIM zinc finger domain-containing protein [Polaromonas sp.]|nr:SWIM zinc finger domain-containing protein [Polaromonas sp.]